MRLVNRVHEALLLRRNHLGMRVPRRQAHFAAVCKRQRMKCAAHAALKRLVNHLMLLHAGFSLEGGGRHHGGEMIVVAGQIGDGDIGVGKRRL